MAVTVREDLVIPADSLMAAVLQGEEAQRRLQNLRRLRRTARGVVRAADEHKCTRVVAASQAAVPLVVAAALLSDDRLTPARAIDCTNERALIVEAVTVLGGHVRACAQALAKQGAPWLGVVIVDRLRPDLDQLDADEAIDSLVVLETA